jgi:hypothetical protein
MLIVPIVGPIVLAGWLAETHRRLARRESPPVLGFRFAELGDYLMAGLVPFAAQLAVSFVAVVPVVFVAGALAVAAIPIVQQGDPSPIVIAALAAVFLAVTLVVVAACVVVLTVMQIRGELTGSFPATFDPRGLGQMIARVWKPALGYSLLLGLLSMPLLLAGLLALFVGVYFVAVALQFAQMHLRWQIYEADLARGGTPLPVRAGNGADL